MIFPANAAGISYNHGYCLRLNPFAMATESQREANYPDVLDRVTVVWRIPPVIPYENVSFSRAVPLEMRRVLLRAFMDLMSTPEGKANMQTIYGIDALQPAEDSLYTDFEEYVQASRLNLEELINTP